MFEQNNNINKIMITLEDFIKAMTSYTALYNEQTWDGHLKRGYTKDALISLYGVYKEGFERGFFQEDSDADDVAVYMVDAWAFVKKSKLTEMCKDGIVSVDEDISVNDIKNELFENDALYSCKGGYILNLEIFEEYFPQYYSYTGESLVTQCDYLH